MTIAKKIIDNWNQPFLRFIVVALILFILWFTTLEFWISSNTDINRFLIENLIDLSSFTLESLGFDLIPEPPANELIRTIGIDGTTGVWVGDPCNGLEIMAIFSIFMLAIPGPIKHKIWFIPSGLLAIHLLNSIRVSALAYIVSIDYSYLDFNHDYVFKVIVFSLIFLLWMLWVKKFNRKKA
ncbi:MAG: archaeosortase/exosortase family protein [Bacteroidota bacterium]